MTTIAAHVLDGEYLLGAESRPEYGARHHGRYWHPAGREVDDDGREYDCAIELWDCPSEIASALERHGTREQEHADGYVAYDVLRAAGSRWPADAELTR